MLTVVAVPVSFFDCCFFFYCCRDHRALHSFPTRRSSDLRAARADGARPEHGGLRLSVARRRIALARRSEEHTSELQSQSNLVCRLVLEKKKREPTGI